MRLLFPCCSLLCFLFEFFPETTVDYDTMMVDIICAIRVLCDHSATLILSSCNFIKFALTNDYFFIFATLISCQHMLLTLMNSFSANCLTFSSTTVPLVEWRRLLEGTAGGQSKSVSPTWAPFPIKLGTLFERFRSGGGGGGPPVTEPKEINQILMLSKVACSFIQFIGTDNRSLCKFNFYSYISKGVHVSTPVSR